MRRIQKILVAIDLSQYSLRTLEYAIDVAWKLGAELVIANVITEKELEMVSIIGPLSPTNMTAKDYIEQQKSQRLSKILALLEYFPEMKQSYKVVFCIGAPHQALIHLVRIHTIGLVILGAKAKRNCAGSFVGSEADKIFQHCPVPVLSLREELEKQHRNKFERASLHAC